MANRSRLTSSIITFIMVAFYFTHLVLSFQHNNIVDDAFITYRYAYYFAAGNGLVYNTGEWVLGTTSPAYAMMLGTLAFVFGGEAIPLISLCINLGAAIIMMMLIALAAYELSSRSYYVALLAPLLVIASEPTITAITFGMEVTVFFAFLTGIVTLMIYDRMGWACFVGGWMLWLRPEGAFVIGLLGLSVLILKTRRQINWQRFIGYGVLLIVPSVGYFSMLITFYNTLLPHSVVSKTSGLFPIPPFAQVPFVFRYITAPLTIVLDAILGTNNPADNSAVVYFGLIAIALFLLIVGSIQAIKINRRLWVLPAYLTIIVVFYSSRSTWLFDWYHANYHVIIVLLMTLGLGQIIYNLMRLLPTEHTFSVTLGIIAVFLALPTLLTSPYRQYLATERHENFIDGRILLYHDAIQTIGDYIPADAIIAAPEIGYIGFSLLENKILDTAGLVSPEIVPYFPVPLDEREGAAYVGAIPKQAIFDFQPDAIITLDVFARAGLYQTEWFDDLYEMQFTIEDQIIFDEVGRLDIFVLRERNDITLSP